MTAFLKNKTAPIQTAIISFVWILLFAIPLLFGDFDDGINWDHIFKIWKEHAMLFVLFMINRFVLIPFLFFNGRRFLYFFSAAAMIFLLAVGVYVANMDAASKNAKRLLPPPQHELRLGPRPAPKAKEFVPPYANLLILGILIIGFDTGLAISMKWIKSEQNRIRLEKENTENKLASLQNQVSPHFFMNTLNNIHALIDINSEEAKESVIRLSRLMSYLLYETQDQLVPLEKELDFIRNYIDLMRLRFNKNVRIELNIAENIPDIRIAPALFISFIENAFKHGISYQKKSYVQIVFAKEDNQLCFHIENSRHPAKADKKEKASGLGIENSKRRLDLLYGNKHMLDINSNEMSFSVNLKIPL